MKKFCYLVLGGIFSIVIWLSIVLVFSGVIEIPIFARYFSHLDFPSSLSELGDSTNIFLGFFSFIALMAALYTLYLQQRSLSISVASLKAQESSFIAQLKRQEDVYLLNSYAAEIQALSSDRQWYQVLSDNYRVIRDSSSHFEEREKNDKKMRNCLDESSRIKNEMIAIRTKIKKISSKLEVATF